MEVRGELEDDKKQLETKETSSQKTRNQEVEMTPSSSNIRVNQETRVLYGNRRFNTMRTRYLKVYNEEVIHHGSRMGLPARLSPRSTANRSLTRCNRNYRPGRSEPTTRTISDVYDNSCIVRPFQTDQNITMSVAGSDLENPFFKRVRRSHSFEIFGSSRNEMSELTDMFKALSISDDVQITEDVEFMEERPDQIVASTSGNIGNGGHASVYTYGQGSVPQEDKMNEDIY